MHITHVFLIILDLKKYLVAGGYYYSGIPVIEYYLSSTETWSPGDPSWTTVSLSPLPRTVYGAGSVSLNNRIYLFGDYSNIGGDCYL